MGTLDFAPATSAVARLVQELRDDQLGGPTPCPAYTVADLLDHLNGLALAFTLSARKEPLPGDGAPEVDGSRLGAGWRTEVVDRLATLAEAWRDPAAYDGTTQAGPIEMPAEVAALVALNEVVVHGWDLARATGQPYEPHRSAVLASLAFVEGFEVPPDVPGGGPFGAPVHVPPDAPALDLLVGAAGRDPGWTT